MSSALSLVAVCVCFVRGASAVAPLCRCLLGVNVIYVDLHRLLGVHIVAAHRWSSSQYETALAYSAGNIVAEILVPRLHAPLGSRCGLEQHELHLRCRLRCMLSTVCSRGLRCCLLAPTSLIAHARLCHLSQVFAAAEAFARKRFRVSVAAVGWHFVSVNRSVMVQVRL